MSIAETPKKHPPADAPSIASNDANFDRLLNITKVISIIGVSRSSIWRWESEGKFPKRLNVGHKRVMWRESELREWIKALS
jgi:prophage regulatory protein